MLCKKDQTFKLIYTIISIINSIADDCTSFVWSKEADVMVQLSMTSFFANHRRALQIQTISTINM